MSTETLEPVEDWFGFVVFESGWVTGIRYDGEQQYDFGTDSDFYNDLRMAQFPAQNDQYSGRFVDFSVRPSLLPLAYVTAYSDGPEPREHEMGEAAAVVHRWLSNRPDVAEMVAESVLASPKPEGTTE
jgi:hypothetical protein